ncbi:hypothetical protein Gotri_020150 [Gossypium trilobum]|uniref:V-SNARE coiled-coil homology domain-containing protein n=1 Tax=Gossypium trilobum TaxID=34281 RepID=A0A7J9D8H5_9ROSI|nr:hypothetical protein [Gossypium trilobum]
MVCECFSFFSLLAKKSLVQTFLIINCLNMADVFIVSFAGRIPFAFLEDIHQRFVRTYGRAVFSALPYGMNDEFSRVLSQQMEYYSSDPNADRINRLKGEMSQVRNVMIENIDKVLERGDRLELLVDKTANMQGNTFRFRKQTRRFRNTGCSNNPPPNNYLCCAGFCLPWDHTTFMPKMRSRA